MSMDSVCVSRFVKARHCIEQPKRFRRVNRDIVVFQGVAAAHVLVRMEDITWNCDCLQGELSGSPCCHVVALEESLDRQVRAPACRLDSERLAQSLAPILVGG